MAETRSGAAQTATLTQQRGRRDLVMPTPPVFVSVEAERLHGDAERAIYGFALRHDDRILLNGRAAVVLKAAMS